MHEFKTYHPLVNFIYFFLVIAFSMVFMHPVCLAISLVSGFCMLLMQKGKKALCFILYSLPLLLLPALINPAFNHAGVTILTYFPSGNPLTLESIFYGAAAAAMIFSVILHFSSYNEVMTSDKFIYLFGKIIPSLSLVFSMILSFVPKLRTQLTAIKNGQKCIGQDIKSGSVLQKAKNGISFFSILITWSLEDAIDTAESMKSRGYGLNSRTSFSYFTFKKRDIEALLFLLILGIYIVVGGFSGSLSFSYFPFMKAGKITLYGASVFFAYLLLFITPIIIECWEVRKWNRLKQSI